MRLMLLLAAGAALAGCQPAVDKEPVAQEATTSAEKATPQATVTPQAAAAAPAEERFVALGTEPFWSVEVTPGQLRYSTPEDIPGAAFAALRSENGAGITYTGTLKGQKAALRIAAGECSDGMSDTVYAYRATFTLAAQELRGCAREGKRGDKR